MVRSSANSVVKCDNVIKKMLLVITVTANSNKWQQALGFVSCAQVSNKGWQHREPSRSEAEGASVDQSETEYEHNMVNTTYTNTSP